MFSRLILRVFRAPARFGRPCTGLAASQTQAFSTEPPRDSENIFSRIEEEHRSKIMKLREKDLPVTAAEDNPFEREKPQCVLCRLNITPDYKNVRLLSQFVSSYTGLTYGRHITGLCRHRQEQVEEAIKRSQACGMMATMMKDPAFLKDPKLFDPERPIRPHRF